MREEKREKKEKRFLTKDSQLIAGGVEIIVDTYTGVNYLIGWGTTYAGLTPLLDEDGKVVIDKLV